MRLLLRLRAVIGYPNDRYLHGRRLHQLFLRHGLEVVADGSAAFMLALRSEADAVELAASLYLPGVPEVRRQRAADLLRGQVGSSVSVPLRRVVLRSLRTR